MRTDSGKHSLNKTQNTEKYFNWSPSEPVHFLFCWATPSHAQGRHRQGWDAQSVQQRLTGHSTLPSCFQRRGEEHVGSSFPVNSSFTAFLTQTIKRFSFLTPVNIGDMKVLTFSALQGRHNKVFCGGREKQSMENLKGEHFLLTSSGKLWGYSRNHLFTWLSHCPHSEEENLFGYTTHNRIIKVSLLLMDTQTTFLEKGQVGWLPFKLFYCPLKNCLFGGFP